MNDLPISMKTFLPPLLASIQDPEICVFPLLQLYVYMTP